MSFATRALASVVLLLVSVTGALAQSLLGAADRRLRRLEGMLVASSATWLSSGKLRETHNHYLQSGSRLYQLELPKSISVPVLTGSKVRVQYSDEPVNNTLRLVTLELLQDQVKVTRQLQQFKSEIPSSLKIVVYIVNMCGKNGGYATSVQDVHALLFKNPANLAGYYSYCSNGVTSLSQAPEVGFKIVQLDLPCSGIGKNGMAWTVNSCQDYNPYGWFDYAELQQTIALDGFHHRIMILPRNHASFMSGNCGWAGLGSTGYVDGTHGLVWISGDVWDNLLTWFHEIGHNYGLAHATTVTQPSCENCDLSNAMGGEGGQSRCLSAPQSNALGWVMPVANGVISVDSLVDPIDINYLPSQTSLINSIVRIESTLSSKVVFISLRNALSPYDNINGPALYIHTWNSKYDYRTAGKTLLQANLDKPGTSWTDLTTQVTIVLKSISTAFASITVLKAQAAPHERPSPLYSPILGPAPDPSPGPIYLSTTSPVLSNLPADDQSVAINYWLNWWQQYWSSLQAPPNPSSTSPDPNTSSSPMTYVPTYDPNSFYDWTGRRSLRGSRG